MIQRKPPKPKTCRVCRGNFTPFTGLLRAKVCGIDCAKSLAQSKRAKEEKKAQVLEKRADRKKREALKTRSDYIKEAQVAVNRYCRLRDFAKGHGCITCGAKLDPSRNADAGHWLGRGAYPEKRFNTFNIALQCVHDNQYQGGLPLKFRAALIARYGEALVEKVQAHQPAQKWSIEYLKRLKAVFSKKARRMEGRYAGNGR